MSNYLEKLKTVFAQRKGPIVDNVIENMRLYLLVLFALFAGFLVYRVNSLVSQSPQASTAEPDPTLTSISKKPDPEVLTTFNEIESQNVELGTSFDINRDNPF
jgi:hypothetical protein